MQGVVKAFTAYFHTENKSFLSSIEFGRPLQNSEQKLPVAEEIGRDPISQVQFISETLLRRK